MTSAFFHEDDYCQVEVLPATARAYCLSEMARISDFAAAHWDGTGFTHIYVRQEPPQSLASLGISITELRAAVEPLLPRFDQVLTGYSSYREPCPSVIGWGHSDGQAHFAGTGESGMVRTIWLALNGIECEQVKWWCRVLGSLPRAVDLLLADWNGKEVVLLSDERALAAYLRGETAEPSISATRNR